MAACPFCHGEVAEVLVLHGGNCPHCFGQIPGEETPTDPGEAVKQQMKVADERHARRRSLMPVFFAAPMVLALAVVAGWQALKPPPKIEELKFDQAFLDELSLDLAEYSGEAEPVGAGAAGGATARAAGNVAVKSGNVAPIASNDGGALTGAGAQAGQLAGGGAGAAATGPRGATVQPTVGEARGPGEIGLAGGASGSTSLDIQLGSVRKKPMLTTMDDIQSAFVARFKASRGQIVQCHERQLKLDPTVGGTWQLSAVIAPSGELTKVRVQPTGKANPALEQCITDAVSAWTINGTLEAPREIKGIPLNLRGSAE